MPLIAGILWNRLLKEMKLEIDATVQYARGKTEKGWWTPIKASDITEIDSPYNTYKYKGLPPHPISNPGINAIEAVLNPIETDCLYYLHDDNREIHCAKTFEEHKANIEKYLK
ncbi:MAG: endolytic transglycosylase MltG [bacterium]